MFSYTITLLIRIFYFNKYFYPIYGGNDTPPFELCTNEYESFIKVESFVREVTK